MTILKHAHLNLGLLCLGFLGLLLLAQTEASRRSLSLALLQGVVLHSGAQGHLQVLVDDLLVLADVVVLHDVLEDGLAR